MSEPTPGQVCYIAWFLAAGLQQIVPWSQLRADGQDAWEAAAQAVLAQCTPQEEAPIALDLDPDVQREEEA